MTIAYMTSLILSTKVDHNSPGGWSRFGNVYSHLNVTVFLDLLNPSSKDAHDLIRNLMRVESPFENVSYEKILNVRIVPLLMPYHFHSY